MISEFPYTVRRKLSLATKMEIGYAVRRHSGTYVVETV